MATPDGTPQQVFLNLTALLLEVEKAVSMTCTT
jgi:hypothetical protein